MYMQLPGMIRSRSWRGFIAEIMVIVLGVLIALAAGNVAEDLNWRRKVAAGERQLLREHRGLLSQTPPADGRLAQGHGRPRAVPARGLTRGAHLLAVGNAAPRFVSRSR